MLTCHHRYLPWPGFELVCSQPQGGANHHTIMAIASAWETGWSIVRVSLSLSYYILEGCLFLTVFNIWVSNTGLYNGAFIRSGCVPTIQISTMFGVCFKSMSFSSNSMLFYCFILLVEISLWIFVLKTRQAQEADMPCKRATYCYLPWPGFELGFSRPQREVLTTIRSRLSRQLVKPTLIIMHYHSYMYIMTEARLSTLDTEAYQIISCFGQIIGQCSIYVAHCVKKKTEGIFQLSIYFTHDLKAIITYSSTRL